MWLSRLDLNQRDDGVSDRCVHQLHHATIKWRSRWESDPHLRFCRPPPIPVLTTRPINGWGNVNRTHIFRVRAGRTNHCAIPQKNGRSSPNRTRVMGFGVPGTATIPNSYGGGVWRSRTAPRRSTISRTNRYTNTPTDILSRLKWQLQGDSNPTFPD